MANAKSGVIWSAIERFSIQGTQFILSLIIIAHPIETSRKTSLFHCSHEVAENNCIIRSFIETCRLRGISMVLWLKAFFNAIIQGRTHYPNLLLGVLTIN